MAARESPDNLMDSYYRTLKVDVGGLSRQTRVKTMTMYVSVTGTQFRLYIPDVDEVVITPHDVYRSVGKLKMGKAAGLDQLTTEHLKHAYPGLYDILALLFSGMLQHGSVPDAFKTGVIVPIPKDRRGDLGDVANYRPICLNSALLKLFERILIDKYGGYFQSSHCQFSYKAKVSTEDAVSSIKETVRYYNDEGSDVFCAFLDSSKAFDKVVHEEAFLELMCRGAPRRLLDIVESLLRGCTYRIRGGDECIRAVTGVKQGSVLSPLLFNLYMDNVSTYLVSRNLGCFYGKMYRGVTQYADDIVLSAPSPSALQKMLDVFSIFSNDKDIVLNVSKSRVLVWGPRSARFYDHAFLYRGVLLPNCATVRFLGVELCRGLSFRTKVDGKLHSFYRGSNSLLSRAGAAGIKSLPHLLFYLYKVHCLPILRYCNKVQLDTLTRRDRAKIRIAHNSMVRRIFSLPRWESVPEYYALDRFLEVSLQQV